MIADIINNNLGFILDLWESYNWKLVLIAIGIIIWVVYKS